MHRSSGLHHAAHSDTSVQGPPLASRRGWFKANAVAVVLLLLGGWICLESLRLPFGSFRMPGAGFFPLLLGITLSVLSILLLGMHLLGETSKPVQALPTRPEVAYLIVTMFVSAWLFERAGYLCTMMLFLGVVLKVLARQRWIATVVWSLLGSVATYVLFGRVLMIGLPSGILPF